jgi:putative ABC transport system ATP-binding protein/lipoprotein-releasing system ATP-binding protein
VIGPRLLVRSLRFGYRDVPGLIVDLDLSVAAGEMVAVRGPSGSGKSTLLYLLGLYLRPDGGSIRLDGQETTSLGDRERSRLRAHRIGFVFQDAGLHPDASLVDNVAEGAFYGGASYAAARARALALMTRYGIAGLAERRAVQVSGGEAQRAALCRALVRDPSLVLADEPTGNLDPENAAAVIEGLRAAADDGAGVVVATHSPAVAEACDRTVLLA